MNKPCLHIHISYKISFKKNNVRQKQNKQTKKALNFIHRTTQHLIQLKEVLSDSFCSSQKCVCCHCHIVSKNSTTIKSDISTQTTIFLYSEIQLIKSLCITSCASILSGTSEMLNNKNILTTLREKLVDIHVYYMSYKHQWLLYFLCLVHHKYSMSIKEKILNMIRSIQINSVLLTGDSRVRILDFAAKLIQELLYKV